MTLIPWSSLGSLEKVETWVLRDHDCPGPDVSQGTRTPTRRLRLSAILESSPGKFHPGQPCAHPSTRAIVGVPLSKG